MINILSLTIPDSLDAPTFSTLLSHLSFEKQSRIPRFIRDQDRMCALGADILARTTICSTLGIKNAVITFTKNEFGKPILENHPSLHFNVSHSGDVVLCAFDDKPIGVDVEKMKDRGLEIAGRFYSKKEYSWLMSKKEGERAECFFDLWTLKESYIKALGKGISKGLRSFTIHPEGQSISIEDDEDKNACTKYYFRQYFVKNGFKAAVCAQNSAFPEKIMERPFEDLWREFLKYTG
jgi:4'-phosphopantetheinyl transferase